MLRLIVGNLNYSSWSMRAWLALKLAGADFEVRDVGIFTSPHWKDKVLSFSGAGKVPILVDRSLTIHESLAISETMAERFPQAHLWPEDAALRARGRAISAEMVSSFTEIRRQMPTNLRGRSQNRPCEGKLPQEIARVLDIWSASLLTSSGQFLLGDFSIADCMYMPLVARFRTYGVEMDERAQAYSQAVFAHPLVQELSDLAAVTESIPQYDALL